MSYCRVWLILGCGFRYLVDKILPHLHMGLDTSDAEGIKTTWQRSVWLVLAVTLHYIPEGLAVVVAFGANAVLKIQSILTYALAFAAGEMIYVVVEELIPKRKEKKAVQEQTLLP